MEGGILQRTCRRRRKKSLRRHLTRRAGIGIVIEWFSRFILGFFRIVLYGCDIITGEENRRK